VSDGRALSTTATGPPVAAVRPSSRGPVADPSDYPATAWIAPPEEPARHLDGRVQALIGPDRHRGRSTFRLHLANDENQARSAAQNRAPGSAPGPGRSALRLAPCRPVSTPDVVRRPTSDNRPQIGPVVAPPASSNTGSPMRDTNLEHGTCLLSRAHRIGSVALDSRRSVGAEPMSSRATPAVLRGLGTTRRRPNIVLRRSAVPDSRRSLAPQPLCGTR
jgi:hypothetical protein